MNKDNTLKHLSNIASGVFSSLEGVRNHSKQIIKSKVEANLKNLDLVKREEFEEIKSMIENCRMYLKGGKKKLSLTLNTQTVESNISKELGKIQKQFSDVSIGSYPFFRLGKVGVSIVIRSSNKLKLRKCEKKIKELLRLKKIKFFKFERT